MFAAGQRVLREVGANLSLTVGHTFQSRHIDLYVEVMHHRSNVWKLRGEASVDGTLSAEGEMLASIVDREP